MRLTDTAIKNSKAKSKPYQLSDGNGLSLLINSNGSKWWRFRYAYSGKEKMLSLGVYPDTPLKRAREKREEARKLIAEGIDPSAARKRAKAALADTFEGVALEWFNKHKAQWLDSHSGKVWARLEKNVFPYIGQEPIGGLRAGQVRAVLDRIVARGAIETAHRILQSISSICAHAAKEDATGQRRAERNVCDDLKGELPVAAERHHAAIIEPVKIGALLRAIDGYDGFPVVKAALQLAPLVFVRPGELRAAEWTEFDLKAAQWEIPTERMKMKQAHIVPLSKQAIAILQELQPLTGRGKYVFPSFRTSLRPMSDNALNAALRRMGFEQGSHTAHGFRAMARTVLDEHLEYRVEIIEHQLAHTVKDANGVAYNRTTHLAKRRVMMQAWADYLDTLRTDKAGV